MRNLPEKSSDLKSPKTTFNMQQGLDKAWKEYWKMAAASVFVEMATAKDDPPQDTIDIDFKLVS